VNTPCSEVVEKENLLGSVGQARKGRHKVVVLLSDLGLLLAKPYTVRRVVEAEGFEPTEPCNNPTIQASTPGAEFAYTDDSLALTRV
jgi:hypothetical protein